MWVLVTRRLRLWLLVAVAGPTLRWALNRAGQHLERHHGQTRASRGLQTAARQLPKRKKSNGGSLSR